MAVRNRRRRQDIRRPSALRRPLDRKFATSDAAFHGSSDDRLPHESRARYASIEQPSLGVACPAAGSRRPR
eukprot:scaffold489_cov259-Pinguiococcus_pyrenoidosus.AAC.26